MQGGVVYGTYMTSNVFLQYTKVAKPVFFYGHQSTVGQCWELLRMTITDSARGPKTSLDVFPDIRASFTHPGNTQKQVLDIPDHVPYHDLVRGLWQKKKDWFWSSKKNVAI